MKEENKKEILTIDKIKKDGIRICTQSIKLYLSRIMLLLPLFALLYLEIVTKSSVIVIVLIAFCMFALLLFVIWEVTYIAIILAKVKKDDFYILNDILIDKRCAGHGAYSRDRSRYNPVTIDSGIFTYYKHKLFFKNTMSKYCIPNGQNYEWSNNKMNQFQTYENAKYGDEFYLLMVKKRILLAYNMNIFYLDK